MVVVFSAGRSGTNLVLEILTGSSKLLATPYPEDKLLFKRKCVYPYNFLTKSDSIYCDCYGSLADLMVKNFHCKIIYTVRHPYDWVMSKIKRGYGHADDATLKGAVNDMYWNAYLYCEVKHEFPNRILTVKMEDVINNIEKETCRMCQFLNIPFEEAMLHPMDRMRHEGKRQRYGNNIDKSQIGLYKNWKTAYDGFLTTIDFNMEDLFKKIEPLLKTFGYDQ